MDKRQVAKVGTGALLRDGADGTTEDSARLGSSGGARLARSKSPALVRRRTQQERRQESEERLLAAALDLLSRKGWVGMTLADVGKAAGYSRGQATHQFGNKGALLGALVTRIHRPIEKQMQAAPQSAAGLQAVLGYVRVYFGRKDAEWVNTRANLLLLAETLLEDSDTVEIMTECTREIFTWLEENLRIGIAQGEVRPDIDPALGAEFVVGVTRGLAQQRLMQGRLTSIRRDKEQVVRMIEQAFAADRDERRSKR